MSKNGFALFPPPQVVMSYLSFLCARLLDLRNETRAARVIQGAWRKYRLKKDTQLFKVGSMFWLDCRLILVYLICFIYLVCSTFSSIMGETFQPFV